MGLGYCGVRTMAPHRLSPEAFSNLSLVHGNKGLLVNTEIEVRLWQNKRIDVDRMANRTPEMIGNYHNSQTCDVHTAVLGRRIQDCSCVKNMGLGRTIWVQLGRSSGFNVTAFRFDVGFKEPRIATDCPDDDGWELPCLVDEWMRRADESISY